MITLSLSMYVGTTLLFTAMAYAVLRGAEWLWRDYQRRSMARLIWLDTDAATARVEYVPTKGNAITRDGKTYLLDGAARYGARTWVVHPRHGLNLVAPADAELTEDGTMRRLLVSDPAMYHRAISLNRTRHALSANDPDQNQDWVPLVAVLSLIGIVAVLGLLVYLLKTVVAGATGAAMVPIPG